MGDLAANEGKLSSWKFDRATLSHCSPVMPGDQLFAFIFFIVPLRSSATLNCSRANLLAVQ
jgi:hypothetical protein